MMKKLNIIINKKKIETDSDLTIKQCAEQIGITIPVLCYSSNKCNTENMCMVCAVYNNVTDSFIPSCCTLVQENMDIDISSDKVLEFRKNVVELLLSEHKGSCMAACQRACPSDFDIPLFMYYIDNDIKTKAKNLVIKNPPDCMNCDARCEKACLRKQYDKAVSIKKYITELFSDSGKKIKNKKPKTYLHTYGKLKTEELNILNKQSGKITGCFNCSCNKNNHCRLQDIAGDLNVSQFKFKPENTNNISQIECGIILFSPGKCIKCGMCVHISDFSFQNRGYKTIIAPPVGLNYSDCIKNKENELVKNCPTGAFSFIIGKSANTQI